MILRRMIVGCLMVVSGLATAGSPGPLTGWRGARGIELSWGEAAEPVTIWRGTEPGKLMPLLTMPAGQSGFLDFSASRMSRYVYAIGNPKSFGDGVDFPASLAPTRILAGLVTTCSGLQKGGLFPADTQNWFFPSRNAHVQYYGYFLLRPFDPAPREAKLVWKDPAGAVVSEYSHAITPKRVDLPDGPVGQVLLAQAIGLREALPQNGQRRVPTAPGLYTVETFIENVPVAVTMWYLREEQSGGRGGTGGVPGPSSPSSSGAQSQLPPKLPLPQISEP